MVSTLISEIYFECCFELLQIHSVRFGTKTLKFKKSNLRGSSWCSDWIFEKKKSEGNTKSSQFFMEIYQCRSSSGAASEQDYFQFTTTIWKKDFLRMSNSLKMTHNFSPLLMAQTYWPTKEWICQIQQLGSSIEN